MTSITLVSLLLGACLTLVGLCIAIRDMVSSSYNRKAQDFMLTLLMVCVIVLFLAVAQLVFQGAVNASLQ